MDLSISSKLNTKNKTFKKNNEIAYRLFVDDISLRNLTNISRERVYSLIKQDTILTVVANLTFIFKATDYIED